MVTCVVVGFTEWGDDADILAQVIAQSQHEYLASLKKTSAAVPKNTDIAAGTSSQPCSAQNDEAAAQTDDKDTSDTFSCHVLT